MKLVDNICLAGLLKYFWPVKILFWNYFFLYRNKIHHDRFTVCIIIFYCREWELCFKVTDKHGYVVTDSKSPLYKERIIERWQYHRDTLEFKFFLSGHLFLWHFFGYREGKGILETALGGGTQRGKGCVK